MSLCGSNGLAMANESNQNKNNGKNSNYQSHKTHKIKINPNLLESFDSQHLLLSCR